MAKSDNISAEKTEAIDQCPRWIVFALCGLYARGLLGWRLCWYIEVTYICVRRKLPGLSLTHNDVSFHPTGRWRYIGCRYQGGGNPQSISLTLCSPDNSQWAGLQVVYLNMIRIVNNWYLFCFYLYQSVAPFLKYCAIYWCDGVIGFWRWHQSFLINFSVGWTSMPCPNSLILVKAQWINTYFPFSSIELLEILVSTSCVDRIPSYQEVSLESKIPPQIVPEKKML